MLWTYFHETSFRVHIYIRMPTNVFSTQIAGGGDTDGVKPICKCYWTTTCSRGTLRCAALAEITHSACIYLWSNDWLIKKQPLDPKTQGDNSARSLWVSIFKYSLVGWFPAQASISHCVFLVWLCLLTLLACCCDCCCFGSLCNWNCYSSLYYNGSLHFTK